MSYARSTAVRASGGWRMWKSVYVPYTKVCEDVMVPPAAYMKVFVL